MGQEKTVGQKSILFMGHDKERKRHCKLIHNVSNIHKKQKENTVLKMRETVPNTNFNFRKIKSG